ncbi:MAG: fructose-6-phosphate aldolase [Acidobacteria bacterium]|nr:fructose-6-phosphate aldolase [Acidobacteriota bacterium]MBI3657887.1 fructose-6-phosphate aldolase [Acidobacteriota bacterium]
MKFFLDTGSLAEIREAAALGIVDGVTTNPSLVAKEGVDFRELIKEICDVVNGPVSAEVLSTETELMIKEGRELAKIHKHVTVKVPMIKAGIPAIKALSGDGIKVNVTLVFSPSQAIIAAKAGAAFVSPFIGRLDDVSEHGMGLIQDVLQIYRNYDYKTEVLVASIRHPMHVVEAAKIGGHIATMPFKVFEQLWKHPLTDIGLDRFLKDWRQAKDKLATAR